MMRFSGRWRDVLGGRHVGGPHTSQDQKACGHAPAPRHAFGTRGHQQDMLAPQVCRELRRAGREFTGVIGCIMNPIVDGKAKP